MPFDPPDVASTSGFLAVVVLVLGLVVGGSGWAARRSGERVGRVVLGVVGMLALWLVITSAPVVAGLLQRGPPLPAFPLFFATVFAGAFAFALGAPGRRLGALPLPALVLFHGFRLPLELVLHSWGRQGAIPMTMTYEGQNYDIVTGVLAFVMAPLAARDARWARLFNVVGLALLLNVLRVVVMSSPLPFSWGVEPPLVLAAYAPYHLIGTVLVAGAMAGHLILFRAVRAAGAS